jgi:hypothetical protein
MVIIVLFCFCYAQIVDYASINYKGHYTGKLYDVDHLTKNPYVFNFSPSCLFAQLSPTFFDTFTFHVVN